MVFIILHAACGMMRIMRLQLAAETDAFTCTGNTDHCDL